MATRTRSNPLPLFDACLEPDAGQHDNLKSLATNPDRSLGEPCAPVTIGVGVFRIGEHEIAVEEDGRVSVTNLWRAAGSPRMKEPWRWYDMPSAREFLADLCLSSNLAESVVYQSRRGRYSGGTWAHWQAALCYAEWLDTSFHRGVHRALIEWSQERANPDLKASRAIDGHVRQGLTTEQACDRVASIAQRVKTTTSLQKEGVVRSVEFARVTNEMYLGLYGANAAGIRKARGLPPKANLRDHFGGVELAQIRHAEAALEEAIKGSSGGVEYCGAVSRAVGEEFSTAASAIKRRKAELDRAFGIGRD